MSDFDFVPVKLRTLPLNFTLSCEIYFRKPSSGRDEKGEAEEDFALLCENQTITQKLVDRLKRVIFPDSNVYIARESVISLLFDKGHFLGYSEKEVAEIRAHENPWEVAASTKQLKKASAPVVPQAPAAGFFSHVKKGVDPMFYSDDAPLEKGSRLEKIIQRYDKNKEQTTSMINTAKKTGRIIKEQSNAIACEVQRQVNETDASLIIRTINRIRTVDEYLHTHCLNVAYLNGLMGKWLGFDALRQSQLVETGLLHDIGKLGVDQDILNKPARLTPEEFEAIKKHPVLSLEMLTKSGVKSVEILEGVVSHHEKLNGTGYPRALNANEISEFARITAISDIYDAMVTRRVYKEPQSPFAILSEFVQECYSELDIKYVDVFINCMAEELKGKEIIVNDGRTGVVLLVNPRKPLCTIIEVDGKTVTMNDELYCVMMKGM